MAPRPKNPPSDRRQEILEGALQVFARKGFAAATNADIAREAGVTAAALYYYFPSKHELFRAAITQRRGALQTNFEQATQSLADQSPEVLIPTLTRMMASFFAEEPTKLLLRIVLSEGPRDPEIVEAWQSYAIGPMAALIFGYMQQQMERGAIRVMDPRMVGMFLIAPNVFLLLTRDLLALPMVQGMDTEQFLAELNHTLLYGLLAKRETE